MYLSLLEIVCARAARWCGPVVDEILLRGNLIYLRSLIGLASKSSPNKMEILLYASNMDEQRDPRCSSERKTFRLVSMPQLIWDN